MDWVRAIMVDWGRWSSIACRIYSALSYIATALLIARFEIGAGVSGASASEESSAVWTGMSRGAEDEGFEDSRTVFCQ